MYEYIMYSKTDRLPGYYLYVCVYVCVCVCMCMCVYVCVCVCMCVDRAAKGATCKACTK